MQRKLIAGIEGRRCIYKCEEKGEVYYVLCYFGYGVDETCDLNIVESWKKHIEREENYLNIYNKKKREERVNSNHNHNRNHP